MKRLAKAIGKGTVAILRAVAFLAPVLFITFGVWKLYGFEWACIGFGTWGMVDIYGVKVGHWLASLRGDQ